MAFPNDKPSHDASMDDDMALLLGEYTAPESVDPTRIDIRFDPTVQRMSGIAAHGYTRFDLPFISQIEGNLWQGGCENGLVLPTFIEHIISLYQWESYEIMHDIKSSMTVKMYDSVDEGFQQVDAIARWVNACVDDGPTLVHCQAGLNRSGLVAARALVLRGIAPEDAIAQLRETRSPAVLCNPAFENWLLSN